MFCWVGALISNFEQILFASTGHLRKENLSILLDSNKRFSWEELVVNIDISKAWKVSLLGSYIMPKVEAKQL